VKEIKGRNNEIDAEDIEEYGLSLNALAESYTHNTIRIRGSYLGKTLVILIVNGSIHNFIDRCIVKKVKVMMEIVITLVVIVVNENVLKCNA
jgi:hypothetical protein